MAETGQDLKSSAKNPPPPEMESTAGPEATSENDRETDNRERMTGALRGCLDRVIDGRVCGWVFDPTAPDKRLAVELVVGDRVLATGTADQSRVDLVKAGVGDGAHAFAVTIPSSLFDGQSHELNVRPAESETPLPGSPILFCEDDETQTGPRVRGQFDRIVKGIAHGWAIDAELPEQRLKIAIYREDQLVAHGVADRFRQDLFDAGIGDGGCAFALPIDPDQLGDGGAQFTARVVEHDVWLPGTPTSVEPVQAQELEPKPLSEQESKPRPGAAPETESSHLESLPKLTLGPKQRPESDSQPEPEAATGAGGTSQATPAQEPLDGGAKLRADNPPQPPFENTRDTRFFFPSSAHAEALSRLFLLTQDRNMGIGVLTGEIGAGKTLLRTLLYARLDETEHLRVSIENSLLDFDGLLLEILSQMQGERLPASSFPDRYTRLAAFKRLLSEQVASRNRHLVILIDESQLLTAETIEGLKALTNIASERQNYLTLILIGQPELRAKLKQLPQVDQRVSLRFHLSGLDRAETGYYVRHRLRAAGFRGEPPVSEDALDLIHQTTRGIPREINRLCKLALEHLLTHNGGELDEDAITIVVNDLRRHGALEEITNEL